MLDFFVIFDEIVIDEKLFSPQLFPAMLWLPKYAHINAGSKQAYHKTDAYNKKLVRVCCVVFVCVI